jgi:hypothetical protein
MRIAKRKFEENLDKKRMAIYEAGKEYDSGELQIKMLRRGYVPIVYGTVDLKK